MSLGYEHHFLKVHDLERFWIAMALDWHLVDSRRRMGVSRERIWTLDYVKTRSKKVAGQSGT
jgi:hypothetical protein